MRKMEMRLQKTQVTLPLVLELTASGGSFDRSLYSEAGYTDYEAVLVGACGGESGRAYGNDAQTLVMYENGGGGGGSLRFKGKLANLQVKTLVTIGAAGSNGADSATRTTAGSGGKGGDTSFNGQTAGGGGGALGGKWSITAFGGIRYVDTAGEGGAGGGNSQRLGVQGIGAVQTSATESGDPNSGSPATTGTYVAGTPAPEVIGGGYGGGGGTGAVDNLNGRAGPVRGGAAGNSTTLLTPGADPGTNKGGGGGGANIAPVIGGPDSFYGSAGGTAGKHVGGVVAIKIS